MKRVLSIGILGLLLPFTAQAATVDVITLLSVDAMFTSAAPAGMTIGINVPNNTPLDISVDTIGGSEIVNTMVVKISGIPTEEVTLDFEVMWEFEGIGVVSSMEQITLAPVTDLIASYSFTPSETGFAFGMGQFATIATSDQDGKYSNSLSMVIKYGLTPIPVPAAFWLLGSGLLGLFASRRRG